MKILHIGQLVGGLDTYIRNTITYSNNEFEFVIIHGKDDKSKCIIKNNKPIKEYQVHLYRKVSFLDFICIFQIIKIVFIEKPDIIHCHSSKGGFWGRIIGAIYGIQTFYTPHAFSFLSAQKKMNRNIFIFIEKMTRFKTSILACSNSEAMLAKKTIGYRKDRINVWNNSVPDASEHIQNLYINTGTTYISTIGRPSFQKNTLFLLRVAKKVIAKKKYVKFYILGVGYYSPILNEVKEFIKNNNLENHIILFPWVSQEKTHQYVAKSAIYISTSLYEGLPLGVIEALSLSKPIVASRVYGNTDCIENEKNGFLLDLDEDIFTSKLIEILDNKDMITKFANNSRDLYLKKFNIQSRIIYLEDIYRNSKI